MSSLTREVINLQVGHYANFVGTHWWNIQESGFIYESDLKTACARNVVKEIESDVMFREGKTQLGEVTYTPRLIAFDLKGSLNTLRQEGVLYDTGQEDGEIKWNSDVTLHKAQNAEKNEFLSDLHKEEELWRSGGHEVEMEENDTEHDKDVQEEEMKTDQKPEENKQGAKRYILDDSIQVWSDFLRIHLHPKSVCLVEQYQHMNEIEPFDIFGLGEQVFKDSRSHHEIEDRIHYFSEECDNMQGFHILADTYNGFGGLTSSILEELEDDFGGKSIMVFSVQPPISPKSSHKENMHELINSIVSYSKLISNSSLFSPLSIAIRLWGKPPFHTTSFPHLNLKSDLNYHTASILAASIETVTLPYRLLSGGSHMTHLTNALTPCGRKLSAMQSSMPFPISEGGTLVDALMASGGGLPWQPLTPQCTVGTQADCQSLVLRGIANDRIKGPPSPSQPRALSSCDTMEDLLDLYLSEHAVSCASTIFPVHQPMKTAAPFPHVFSKEISPNGCLSGQQRPEEQCVESIPVLSSLQSTSAVRPLLDSMCELGSKVNINKHHRFVECGLEEDEFKEALHLVDSLRECYEESAGEMS